MCVLRHTSLCDDSVIHQMWPSRAKQKYALAPGALSRETNYAAYASAAASGQYRVPNIPYSHGRRIIFRSRINFRTTPVIRE